MRRAWIHGGLRGRHIVDREQDVVRGRDARDERAKVEQRVREPVHHRNRCSTFAR